MRDGWKVKQSKQGYEIYDERGKCVGKYANKTVAAAHHAFAIQKMREEHNARSR